MPRGIYIRLPGKTAGIRGAILELYASGWSQRQVAKLFKISEYSVLRLLRGDWNPQRKQAGEKEEGKVKYHARLIGVPIAQTQGRPQERLGASLEGLRAWGADVLKRFGGKVEISELKEEVVETLTLPKKEPENAPA